MNVNERVLNVLSNSLNNIELTDESCMENTKGWDSMSFVDIVLGLETEFNIAFSTLEAAQLTSHASIVDIVKRKAPN
ncbi:acyl carrier protein [Pseudomonadales bacterium]|jgi:acyl carrier protein|nr:acyl carrier protein [Pseudomonadales bacterium]MDB2543106.1 acyl carrier protein [Pseudomonadales bacterium]